MPRVPISVGPQVQDNPINSRGAMQAPVDVSAGLRGIARGGMQLGEALEQRQMRADQDSAFATDAKLKSEWLAYESQLRESRQGRDAATYDTEVEAWWKDAASRYGKDLSPGAARLVNRSLVTSQLQAMAGAKAYKNQQLDASATASYNSAQTVSVNEAATVGNEPAVIKAQADMDQKRMERAALKGWTPEQVEADKISWNTTLHGVVVQKMAKTDPVGAQAYYEKYKDQIAADKQPAIENALQQTTAAVEGNVAASQIWRDMGPKADGQPVELDKMEEAARAKFPNDPFKQKAAIAEVQQRAAAFNSAERERTAGKVNNVMAAYNGGASLSTIRSSSDFQNLPGAEKARIEDHIRDRNHMLWAQSVEDRARLEREQQQKAFPTFLDYSNPDKLATMTRAQVQALVPTLGNELTGHLVQKWDAMQKPAAKLEARMDTEDFNHVADKLGLNPFKANTEEKKRQLGELKYRVEQMIDNQQQRDKKPMKRSEKMELMADEMSRTVTINGWFSNDTKPVITLTGNDAKKIIVPDTDRAQIVDALQRKYKATNSSLYAPTEENVRRLYLMNRSSAAALVPNR